MGSTPPFSSVVPDIVQEAPILTRLICCIYHQCIVAQRALITNYIGKSDATTDVGGTSAVRPNWALPKNLDDPFTIKEGANKITINRVNKHRYLHSSSDQQPFEESTCSRNNIPRTGQRPHPTPTGAVFPSTNKLMVKLRSSAAKADTTPGAGGKEATAVKVLAPGSKPPLALRSSKHGKEDSKLGGLSTPNRPALKAPGPKGSSPMAHDEASLELENMELHIREEESKAKSNPKSNDDGGSGEGGDEDDTSIGRAIQA
jgi:hypothetical protein